MEREITLNSYQINSALTIALMVRERGWGFGMAAYHHLEY